MIQRRLTELYRIPSPKTKFSVCMLWIFCKKKRTCMLIGSSWLGCCYQYAYRSFVTTIEKLSTSASERRTRTGKIYLLFYFVVFRVRMYIEANVVPTWGSSRALLSFCFRCFENKRPKSIYKMILLIVELGLYYAIILEDESAPLRCFFSICLLKPN